MFLRNYEAVNFKGEAWEGKRQDLLSNTAKALEVIIWVDKNDHKSLCLLGKV